MEQSAGQLDHRKANHPLAWGLFLGSSWTWCIGMFLPVLLVRQMGLWGWVQFAVPNVIGAAAMGWVMRSAGQSRGLVQRHAGAMAGFSIVTIAFHAFFAGWIIYWLLGPAGLITTVALAGFFHSICRRENAAWLALAGGVFLLSAAAMVWFFSTHAVRIEVPVFASLDAAWLAPVSVFGFLLCPYLDLTFHRARQSTSDAGAKLAFGTGFGVFFLLMIVFTLAYAAALALGLEGRVLLSRPIRLLIGGHLMAQSAFTMAAHWREIREVPAQAWATMAAVALGATALVVGLLGEGGWLGAGGGELVYRTFMGFYGLLFPAYVWLIVLGRADRRRRWSVWLIAVAAALPFFWLGFIEDRMPWLTVGLAIVLISAAASWPARRAAPGRGSR